MTMRKKRVKIPGRHSRRFSTLLALAAISVALYSPISQWWNNYLHLKALDNLSEVSAGLDESQKEEMLKNAHEWNEALTHGDWQDSYPEQLSLSPGSSVMARLRIPVIDVDLPVYHYSTDDVLRKGVGHMEETTLPVGGDNTHSALTAHRGLAESKLFTDLDKVKLNDSFIIDVLGDSLYYKVVSVDLVEPEETNYLNIQQGRDLVTLVTCDPIGINSHRILVLGERFYPDLDEEIPPEKTPLPIPAPWPIIWFLSGATLILAYYYWSTKRAKKRYLSRLEQRENKTEENSTHYSENIGETVDPTSNNNLESRDAGSKVKIEKPMETSQQNPFDNIL